MAEGSGVRRILTAAKRWAYERFGRDQWQQPDRVIATLALKPGHRVADLGSGGGYFTFRPARAVAPDGIVYAVDVDRYMLADLTRRAEREGLVNIRPVEPGADDPSLPEAVDLIFVSKAYHHLEDRAAYFASAAKYLRPGGRVAVIEGTCEGLLGRLLGHATPPEKIQREMEEAGYRLAERHEFIRRESFSIFAPAGA
jgi:ubiquinone/menaquinone biosynthesis C-methylase UbiE